MGKMYTLTEENYMEVLNRLEKICNKFRLLEKYECFELDEPVRTKKENYSNKVYEFKSWGIKEVFDGEKIENGEVVDFLTHEESYAISKFIHPTKHAFKIAYEKDSESFNGKLYKKMKSLIHISISGSEAIVLGVGDKVKFEKWGFILYTDNNYTRFKNKLNVYKNTYIIDRKNGKIELLKDEISKRNIEYEEDTKWWDGLLYDEYE